jgi:hypothetical protein
MRYALWEGKVKTALFLFYHLPQGDVEVTSTVVGISLLTLTYLAVIVLHWFIYT